MTKKQKSPTSSSWVLLLTPRMTMTVILKYAIVAFVSFVMGRSWKKLLLLTAYWKTEDNNINNKHNVNGKYDDNKIYNDLALQIQVQQEFQSMIQRRQRRPQQQYVSSTHYDISLPLSWSRPRFLTSALEHAKDGFASELQYVARLLQIATSTQRTLVMTPQFKSAYEPPDCRRAAAAAAAAGQSVSVSGFDSATMSGWECLWESLSNMTIYKNIVKNSDYPDSLLPQHGAHSLSVNHANNDTIIYNHFYNTLRDGILPNKPTSSLFDTAFYGPTPIMPAPISFPRRGITTSSGGGDVRADVIPHWERTFGRYWVRAQMAHYLWNPNPRLRAQIQARIPHDYNIRNDNNYNNNNNNNNNGHLMIGFHIRYTDNIRDFQKHFARNASVTRSFERFMDFANRHIRAKHPTATRIYLATDNTAIVDQSRAAKWKQQGWTFLVQTSVERSTTRDRLWFSQGRSAAAAAIATDIELLRRADFLVGSFQSNVYRLACQLNTAFHTDKYPWDLQRHWTVDVEWYEDP